MTETFEDRLMERIARFEDMFLQLVAAVEDCAKQLDMIYYGMP